MAFKRQGDNTVGEALEKRETALGPAASSSSYPLHTRVAAHRRCTSIAFHTVHSALLCFLGLGRGFPSSVARKGSGGCSAPRTNYLFIQLNSTQYSWQEEGEQKKPGYFWETVHEVIKADNALWRRFSQRKASNTRSLGALGTPTSFQPFKPARLFALLSDPRNGAVG